MDYALDFEKPVQDLENQIKELREASKTQNIDITKEMKTLQLKVDQLIHDIYSKLSPWERVQLARHPKRPHASDLIELIIKDFKEISGDRSFGDDQAMITGFGFLDGLKVAVIGIEKGRKTNEKISRNFGMPRPEGYRKALRLMKLASQFEIPVVVLVDTPGAFPGIDAEERGQSSAIAENLAEMFDLKCPIVAIIIGEGGSGGALGVAVADRVLMMEYSVYSVISPESCASILWADPKNAENAANVLKLVPDKALELKVVDGIIEEPPGGAHKDIEATALIVKNRLIKELNVLIKKNIKKLLEERYLKFREMGNATLNASTEDNLEVFMRRKNGAKV